MAAPGTPVTTPVAHPAYPFTSRWFDHGAYQQHYVDEGSGPPVLMLHGNPTWSYLWRNLIGGLSGSHRCVAPDHVGMGLSSRPAESAYRYTLRSRVDDLDALTSHLIEHAGLPGQGWTLVTHDWGGAIGLAWAARHPELVARLVVLNTAAFPSPYGPRLPWSLRLPLWAIKRTTLARWLVLRHNLFARAAMRLGVTRRLPREVRQAYLTPYATPEDRLAILRFVQDIPLSAEDPAWLELLAAERGVELFADRPTLVGWGTRDPVFRDAFLTEWRRRLPDAKYLIYDQAGHYPLEDETEEVIAGIRTFLSAT